MEELYDLHQVFLSNLSPSFRRSFIDEVDWTNRLIAIKGARGVGKSTLILQHIKEVFGSSRSALYVSVDNIAVNALTLFDIARYHNDHGGTHLFLDEIHKYDNWSQEIKNSYDLLPKLFIVITSSSILQLYNAHNDLSRRMVSYQMQGLSFREYIEIEEQRTLPKFTIEELTESHTDLVHLITKDVNILSHFNNYLQRGYYPFFLEHKGSYLLKLNNIINLTIDIDLPYILGTSVQNIFKIKKLLYQLATEVPFQPNVTKLAGAFELTRSTLNSYIHYLNQACLLNLLIDERKSYSNISKPEKIFLHNTNLAYALAPSAINRGALRETFFFNQVSVTNSVTYTKTGDFKVDNNYIFEVGGRSKTQKQIFDIPNSFLAIDETLQGSLNSIPLWLFGFLY